MIKKLILALVASLVTSTAYAAGNGSPISTIITGSGDGSNLTATGLNTAGSGITMKLSDVITALSLATSKSSGAVQAAGGDASGTFVATGQTAGSLATTVTADHTLTIETGAYNPAIGDCGKTFRYTSATPITITFGVGAYNGSKLCKFYIEQGGAGVLTFAAASGETMNQLSTSPLYSTKGIGSLVVASIDSPTNFTLSGDIASLGLNTAGSANFVETTPSGLSYANVNFGKYSVSSTLAGTTDPFWSPDAFQIGGVPLPFTYEQSGQTSQGAMGSLVISNQPWGPINAGCSLCILWGSGNLPESGVANKDWRPGANNVTSEDAAAEYIGTYNSNALLIIPAASYTATSIVPATPLTVRQMAMLRLGMYISTNSIDAVTPTGLQTNAAGELTLPAPNYFHGVISGWASDGSSISVAAWKTSANQAAGNIPGTATANLDTYWTNYGTPTVFIGNSYNTSARNEYLTYDGTRSNTSTNSGKATALSHNALADEIDLRYYATQPNEVRMGGIVISVAGSSGTPVGRAALTQDSTAFLISGDIHHSMTIDEPSDGNPLEAHSFWFHGYQGVQTGVNTVAPSFSFTTQADSSKENLIGYMFKENNLANNYPAASYHLGLHYDGDVNNPTTTPNSAGEFVWNAFGAESNSLSICAGYGSTGNLSCGFTQHQNGTISFGANDSNTAWARMNVPSSYTGNDWEIDDNGIAEAIIDNSGTFRTTNASLLDLNGVNGGRNGVTVGIQPSGHVAGLGLYTNASYGNNILEVYNGLVNEMTMSSNGALALAGNLTLKNPMVQLMPGATVPWLTLRTNGYVADAFIPDNDIFVGGLTANPTATAAAQYVNDGHIHVQADLDGAGEAGGLITAVDSPSPFGYHRINNILASPAQTASYGAFNGVLNYNYLENTKPRFAVNQEITDDLGQTHTVTYSGGNQVNFSPALTPLQISQIHINQWIVTNSRIPNPIATPQLNGIPSYTPNNVYGGLVSNWDPSGNWIQVYGWAPFGGTYVAGQNPSTNYDTYLSNFPDATVFVGAPTSNFVRNSVCDLEPSNIATNNNYLSMVRGCTLEEHDIFFNPGRDYFGGVQGYVISFAAGQTVTAPGIFTTSSAFFSGINPGDAVQLTATATSAFPHPTLPAGLTATAPPLGLTSITYYVIKTSTANQIELAATSANATASTPVPVVMTSIGAGTLTLTGNTNPVTSTVTFVTHQTKPNAGSYLENLDGGANMPVVAWFHGAWPGGLNIKAQGFGVDDQGNTSAKSLTAAAAPLNSTPVSYTTNWEADQPVDTDMVRTMLFSERITAGIGAGTNATRLCNVNNGNALDPSTGTWQGCLTLRGDGGVSIGSGGTTYLVMSPTGVLNASEGITVQPTGSTTSRNVNDRFSDTCNVKDYGAVGDGTTDDSAAFRRAFAQAILSTTCDEVYAPSATYYIGSSITASVPGGQSVGLRGDGADLTVLHAATNTDAVNITLGLLSGASVQGLTINRAGSTTAGNTALNIYETSTKSGAVTVRDVHTQSDNYPGSWLNGIVLTSTDNAVVDGVFTVAGFPPENSNGLVIKGLNGNFAVDTKITNTKLQGGNVGLLVSGYVQGVIATNFFAIADNYGVQWKDGLTTPVYVPELLTVSHGHIDSEIADMQVYGLSFTVTDMLLLRQPDASGDSTPWTALDLSGSTSSVISGNNVNGGNGGTFTGTENFVHLNNTSATTITGNTVTTINGAAVQIDGTSTVNVISGNMFNGVGSGILDNTSTRQNLTTPNMINGVSQDGSLVGAVTTHSAFYNPVASDCGTTIRYTSGTGVTITIPTGLPVGCKMEIMQAGSGTLTFAAASGETLEQYGSSTSHTTLGQFAQATVKIDTATTFLLAGGVQ